MQRVSSTRLALAAVATFALAVCLLGLEFAGVRTLSLGGASVDARNASAAALAVGLGLNATNDLRAAGRRQALFWALWAVGIPLSVADVSPPWVSWVGAAAVVASVLVSREVDRRVRGRGAGE